jgi:hypothetical protein
MREIKISSSGFQAGFLPEANLPSCGCGDRGLGGNLKLLRKQEIKMVSKYQFVLIFLS